MNFNVKRLISKSVDTPTDTNSATEKVKKNQQLCLGKMANYGAEFQRAKEYEKRLYNQIRDFLCKE